MNKNCDLNKIISFAVLIILIGPVYLHPSKTEAAVMPPVVITEIMYDAKGIDSQHEWVEILNTTIDSIKITNWRFNDGSNHLLVPNEDEEEIWIASGEYLILTDDRNTFLQDYPEFEGQVIDTVMAMNNTSDTISIIDNLGQIVDSIIYHNSWGAAGNGRTLEKIKPELENIPSNWQESYVIGGTPGKPASQFYPPDYPAEIFELVNFEHAIIKSANVTSIVDGDTIKVSGLAGFPSEIRLLAVDCPESNNPLFGPAKDFTHHLQDQEVDLVISQEPEEQIDRYNRTLAVIIFENKIFNTQLLERGLATYFETTNSVLKNEAWKTLEQKTKDQKLGIWASSGGRSVILSEILPDPVGSDAEGEWIEIFNPLDREIDLSYFLLNQYVIAWGTKILAKSYFIFPRNETKIVLNNDGDIVKLSFPDGLLIDQISYTKAPEGKSFALVNGTWYWTTPTAGIGNILPPGGLGGGEEYEEVSIEIAKTRPVGSLVRVEGVVTVPPGIISTRFFYIQDSGGIQVYCYAGDFPTLRIGDKIKVWGEIGQSYGEKRIKIDNADDIQILSSGFLPSAQNIKTSQAENFVGSLVRITGRVIKKSGLTFWLSDSSNEIKIYLSSKVEGWQKISKNDILIIFGIVNKTHSGVRILPRNPQDIIILQKGATLSTKTKKATQILGVSSAKAAISNFSPGQDYRKNLAYIGFNIVGIIIIIFGLLGLVSLFSFKTIKYHISS